MKNLLTLFIFIAICSSATAEGLKIRIKDASRIDGMESYFVTGFGIVVGLNGSGDSDKELTQHTLSNMLKNFNIDITESELKVKNCAAVKITALIRGGLHKGDTVNATISTVGNATSLQGGTLLMSPIIGSNGKICGIAQGSLVVGGFSFGEAGPGGDTVIKNVPTGATLVNGLKLTKDFGNNDYLLSNKINFLLKEPDFTSAQNMAAVINTKFNGSAIADTESQVRVNIPKSFTDQNKRVAFISQLQQLRFEVDRLARVVINERTGTIVVGGEVKISEVAISHGNIIVNIKNTTRVSQPTPDGGRTVVANDGKTKVNEELPLLHQIPAISNIQELVTALNKLGVTPRDMMSIFQTLREAGALHAELITQ